MVRLNECALGFDINHELNCAKVPIVTDDEGAAKAVATIAAVAGSNTSPPWAGLTCMRSSDSSGDVARSISIYSEMKVADIGLRMS